MKKQIVLVELIKYYIWYLSINWKNMIIKRVIGIKLRSKQ